MTMLSGAPASWVYEVARLKNPTHVEAKFMVIIGNTMIPGRFWKTIKCRSIREANLIASAQAVNNCHAKEIKHTNSL